MTELTMAMMTALILVKSKMLQSMKRIISNVMLIAAAATAFFSCQKQESLAPEKAQDVVLTFSSEKPSFTDETKTEWTGTTVQWSAGDKISIAYTVDGEWMGAINSQTGDVMGTKLYKSKALESAGEKAKFDVSTSFNIDATGTHVFYGVYPAPSSTDFPNAPVANLEIPSAQTPKEDSFDGAADIMTGVSVGEFTARPAANEVISMVWTRLVAHANITLTALKDVTAGEKVLSITLTAQDGANLVGKQKVNILTNEVENNNTDSNVLKINGANLSVDSGNIEFWACVLPETITALTVVVDTDKATYTREITGISKTFKQNARNTLKIKMNEAIRVAKEVVTSDYSGTYVIVAKRNSENKYYYMTNDLGTASTKRFTAVEAGNARPEDVTPLSDAYHWEIAKSDDLYTAKSVKTNTYISWTSGNSACLKDQGVQFTIAPNEDGTYKFQYVASDATRYLSLNGTAGNNYFAWYKDGQSKDLYLIPVAPDTTPKIVVAETEKTIGSEGGDLEFEYTVANTDSELEATVTQGADFLESVEVENEIIAVTVAENETASERIAKITLTCGDATHVVLIITQEGKVVVDDSFEPGLYWIMATEDGTTKVMTPLGENANYGYGQTTTVTDGRSYARNAFTFTAVEGGFTIQDVLGRYYYADDEHQSFQLGTNSSTDGLVWTISVNNDGTYVLTNVGSSRVMKYGDGTYTTFGVYKDSDEETGVYPTLVKADNPLPVELSSISVNGHKTSFAEGDTFEFGGTVTANYSDGTTKNVTANASVTTPEMVNGASVTVSYTEGGITKTFSYNITVKAAGVEEVTIVLSAATKPCDTFPEGSNGSNVKTSYTIGDYEWTFAPSSGFKYSWYTDKYILWGKSGGYILMPAVPGKKLTSVKILTGKSASKSVKVGVYNADGTAAVSGGEAKTLSQTNAEFTWTLTGTEVNTHYQLRVTSAHNAQLQTLTLIYE